MTRPYSLAGSASRASDRAPSYNIEFRRPGVRVQDEREPRFHSLSRKTRPRPRAGKTAPGPRQRRSRSDPRAAVTKALPPSVSLAADLIRPRRREPRVAAVSHTLSVWSQQREHAQVAKHPSAEHHHNAASHHHAAAHHHHQAEHHHAMGEHEEAQDHAKAAKEHSELAHKHSETAHEHSHE
jgi:hypothetical protein